MSRNGLYIESPSLSSPRSIHKTGGPERLDVRCSGKPQSQSEATAGKPGRGCIRRAEIAWAISSGRASNHLPLPCWWERRRSTCSSTRPSGQGATGAVSACDLLLLCAHMKSGIDSSVERRGSVSERNPLEATAAHISNERSRSRTRVDALRARAGLDQDLRISAGSAAGCSSWLSFGGTMPRHHDEGCMR